MLPAKPLEMTKARTETGQQEKHANAVALSHDSAGLSAQEHPHGVAKRFAVKYAHMWLEAQREVKRLRGHVAQLRTKMRWMQKDLDAAKTLAYQARITAEEERKKASELERENIALKKKLKAAQGDSEAQAEMVEKLRRIRRMREQDAQAFAGPPVTESIEDQEKATPGAGGIPAARGGVRPEPSEAEKPEDKPMPEGQTVIMPGSPEEKALREQRKARGVQARIEEANAELSEYGQMVVAGFDEPEVDAGRDGHIGFLTSGGLE